MSLLVAFSGGKDSTAMALKLAEAGERFELFFTPTGDELPELEDHIQKVVERVRMPLIRAAAPTLFDLIEKFESLPNFRQRWCTRMIKIVPCIAHLKAHPGTTLAVGLRADEETRQGLYGEFATYRYPLREWGMTLSDVQDYVRRSGLQVPVRTDCALCYGQRLGEWWDLWKRHPGRYQRGVELEHRYGHTFRSPGRDTQPASLVHLRRKFEDGYVPRGARSDGEEDDGLPCRVCRV